MTRIVMPWRFFFYLFFTGSSLTDSDAEDEELFSLTELCEFPLPFRTFPSLVRV